MPLIEFVSFKASEALVANPLLINGPLEALSKAEGYIRAHSGRQIEDNKIFYVAIEWVSVEAHTKFTTTPKFVEGSALMMALVEGAPAMHHIAFHRDPTVAFGAPVTEIEVFNLNEGKSKQDLEDAVDNMLRIADKIPGIHLPGSVGEVVETPGTFYIVAGWDTVEQHLAALQNDSEEIKPFSQKVGDAIAPGASMVHARFTKF